MLLMRVLKYSSRSAFSAPIGRLKSLKKRRKEAQQWWQTLQICRTIKDVTTLHAVTQISVVRTSKHRAAAAQQATPDYNTQNILEWI